MGSGARLRWLVVLAFVVLSGAPGPAAADVYEPTRMDDPPPGKCKANDCSLREAFMAANPTPEADTIKLGKGTYEMELAPAGGSGGADGNWWTYGSTVVGKGPGKTTLDANGIDTVMQLGNFIEQNRLEGVRVTGGLGTGSAPGGVIGAGSRMTLKNVVIAGNTAAGSGGGAHLLPRLGMKILDSKIIDNESAGGGGGIFLAPGSAAEGISATIRRSTFSRNSAPFGGGIYSRIHSLTLSQSTVAGNDATEGGGLDLVSDFTFQPTTRIQSSTISGNSALKGGGILADGNQPGVGLIKPVVEVVNSTIAQNTATADGGGIMADNAATLVMDNSTVAYNTADSDHTGGGVAGGIYQHSGAPVSLGDSLIAQNAVGSSGTGEQCAGTFGGNPGLLLQMAATGSCSVSGSPLIVLDASLGVFGSNGGPTKTVGLRSGSAAIGLTDGCPNKDQRGRTRPESNCDSGSFERP